MLINIQHEETGRLQEWQVDKPIPHAWARVSEPFESNAEGLCHDHKCSCGTATHTPHETGTCGCVRSMTEAPKPSGAHETLGCPMWEVGGHRITDFSLRQQRGYNQHSCGCWSWSQDSTNSIED